ncbi:epsin [Acrasis kona]|uniref:Epsin n=1 Tax=Acrasis kona TaxID=1008807 RepID=A0AAW2ZB71_9EUKA
MNYIKNIRNAALYAPYEIKVRDLTSNDPYPGNAQKARKDVAEATGNYESFLMTMRVLWERMADTGKNWRHVYKGLQLLEYLLVYGHENVVHDAKNNIGKVKILKTFAYIDEHTFNDYGEGVRRLAERVLGTLSEDHKLDEYRALADKGQFQGFPKLTEPSQYSQKNSKNQPQRQPQRREEDDEPRRQPQRQAQQHYDDDDRAPRRQPQQQQRSRYDDDEDDRPPQRQQPPQRQPQQQQQRSRYDDDEDDRPPQRQQRPPQSPQQRSQQYDDSYDERRAPQQQYQSEYGDAPQNRPNQSGLDFFFDDEVEIAFQQAPPQARSPTSVVAPPPVPYSPARRSSPIQQQQQQYYDEQPQQSSSSGERLELENLRSELYRVLKENESMKEELVSTKAKYEELWKSMESRQ